MIHTAAFSGGRSSARMVYHLLETDAPLDRIVFADTGIETAETYEFIKAVDADIQLRHWSSITALRYLPQHPYAEEVPVSELCVQFDTFRKFFDKLGMPRKQGRTCTDNLKIRSSVRWLMHQHDCEAAGISQYIGFRADEPHRVFRRKAAHRRLHELLDLSPTERRARGFSGSLPAIHHRVRDTFPLYEAGIKRADVFAFWATKQKDLNLSFDLTDPNIRISNCVGCINLTPKGFTRAWQTHPETMEIWSELEQTMRGDLTPEQLEKRQARAEEALALWKQQNNGRPYPGNENLLGFWGAHPYPITFYKYKEDAGMFHPDDELGGGCGDGHCGLDI